MISVKYFLRDKTAKRKSSIRGSVTFGGNRVCFCPGYHVFTEEWDCKTGLPKLVKGNGELSNLTLNLKDLELRIQRMFNELTSFGSTKISPYLFSQRLRQLVHPNKYGLMAAKQLTLLEFMELFIKDSENGVRLKDNEYRLEGNTIKPYRTTRDHLKEFQSILKREFFITDFSQNLHDEFSDYLIDDLCLSKNTHSKYIMVLMQVMKYAVKKKMYPSHLLNEIEFATSREESDNIYLNESEIELFIKLNEFRNKGEEVVRDIFVVGCYTGLRFSNYSKLNLDYLQDDLLTTIQVKTNKKVTIPTHIHVKGIISKYNGVLPTCPTNQEFNRTLKDLGKRIPELNVPFIKQITRKRQVTVEESVKWEKLMTHTARGSFCTNMYLRGIPVLTIMAISGHRTEKSFRTYIKATGEEHAKIMKKHWDEAILHQ